MAKTELRGGNQIKNNTVLREDLVLDFLGAANWDITNGAQNATLVGLAQAVLGTSPVTLDQLNSTIAGLGGLIYKGAIDVATPTPDLNAIASVTGDFYLVSVGGTYLGQDWAVGDMMIVNKDVAIGAITNADVDKIDNTEDPLNLKQADVVDNLASTGVTNFPLSANQGYILDQMIQSIAANVNLRAYGENKTVTHNVAVLPALLNIPVSGTERVFLNGIRQERGSGNDYTISLDIITFEENLKSNDKVIVDYEY